MAETRFRVDIAGVREVLHSPGVQAELEQAAASMCGAANAAARGRAHWHMDVDPYGHAVDQGKFTSLGVVFTRTRFGRVDEARHQTLEGLNH